MSTQVGNLQNIKCRFSFVLQKLFFGTLTLVFLNSLVFAENEALIIDKNGNVGIGIETPRSALDTGTGVISGAANGYQKAQFSLSGGGKVTWGGPGGRLKWTRRFIAISMEKSSAFPDGYININQPVSDIPAENVYDNKKRSVNEDGVLLKEWEALYAVHALGGKKDEVSFRIVYFKKVFNAPSNWLLVAVVNKDDQTIKLGTGTIITKNSTSDRGSPLPSGVIVMWSGLINNIPDGWALCNGKNDTPDLQDRFIVGAGKSYSIKDTGGSNSVTLTVSQMPSHNHANGEYSSLVRRNKSSDGKEAFGSGGSDNTNRFNLRWHSQIRSNGGNKAHENRPLYYALAYIMKL